MKSTKAMNFIKKLLFNVVETIVIFMIGLIFKIDRNYIIVLMITFFLARSICGQPKHYKRAYQCFIWSTLVFTSVYALTDLHIIVTILLTLFTGFIITGRANIEDMYMWKGSNSKYQDIEEYVKFNQFDDKLIEYEGKLKKQDNLMFLIYKYRFKDHLTFNEISDRLDGLDTSRISEKLNEIAFSIRIYCEF